jgi:hypothetical protein
MRKWNQQKETRVSRTETEENQEEKGSNEIEIADNSSEEGEIKMKSVLKKP